MAEELFIPKLGQTVEQVTLINWLVKDGDKVKQGQEVLEVETDKAVFNVEAVDDGFIHLGPFKAGDVLPVLAVVATIGEEDETFKAPTTATAAAAPASASPKTVQAVSNEPVSAGKAAAAGKVFASPRAKKMAAEKNLDLSRITPTGEGGLRVTEKDVLNYMDQSGGVKVSPVAKRMAEEAGLDLRNLQGSGLRGEITKADVEAGLASRAASPAALKTPSQPAPVSLPPMQVSGTQALSGVRRVIAQRMGASAQTTARVTLLMDADATDLVVLREKLKAKHESKWGFAPFYN